MSEGRVAAQLLRLLLVLLRPGALQSVVRPLLLRRLSVVVDAANGDGAAAAQALDLLQLLIEAGGHGLAEALPDVMGPLVARLNNRALVSTPSPALIKVGVLWPLQGRGYFAATDTLTRHRPGVRWHICTAGMLNFVHLPACIHFGVPHPSPMYPHSHPFARSPECSTH